MTAINSIIKPLSGIVRHRPPMSFQFVSETNQSFFFVTTIIFMCSLGNKYNIYIKHLTLYKIVIQSMLLFHAICLMISCPMSNRFLFRLYSYAGGNIENFK